MERYRHSNHWNYRYSDGDIGRHVVDQLYDRYGLRGYEDSNG